MPACRYLLVAIALLTVAAGEAAAQPAFDCTQAKTPTDKAICGNPELSTADADMSAAYSALSKDFPAEQKAGLLANQRQWLKDRNNACTEATGDALAGCLLTETKKRRAFLVGEGDNGSAGAPPLLPVFLNEAKKDAYDITVAYPQFAPPTGAKFNVAVQELTIAKKTLADYRQDKPNQYNGSSNFYQVTYDITYLAPRLAAVTFQFADYQGGAHPNNWRAAMLWDVKADKDVALADIFADPKAAVPAISAICKDKLAVEAKKEGWDFFDNPDFAAVVGDAKNWSVAGDGVTVMFDPYSVAAYVVGPRDCRLTYAELKGWLKPDGALPPSH
jgi:uncharacterized protein YecT (DUF1311 family)